MRCGGYHTSRMGVLVQIRDVPDEVHRTLKARAARLGTSLSEYLRQELERVAAAPTPDELAARLDAREPIDVSTDEIVRIVREARDAAS